MAPLNDTLIAAGLCVAGPILFERGFRLWRRRRLIEDTPTARIRSMAMGLVEVTGAVHGRSLVSAPFSGHDCVYWQVDIAVRGRRQSWQIVHRNASGQPFYLADDTGVAMVYPAGAEVHMSHGVEEICSGLALPECYAEYLKEHSTAVGPLARLSTLRFRERVLQEGQALYVIGTAMPRAHEVVISDAPALAATGTDGPAAPRVKELRERDAEVRGVIRQGERERTFILSQESEKQLEFGMGLQSVAMLAGGPLLALFGLWMWLETWGGAHH